MNSQSLFLFASGCSVMAKQCPKHELATWPSGFHHRKHIQHIYNYPKSLHSFASAHLIEADNLTVHSTGPESKTTPDAPMWHVTTTLGLAFWVGGMPQRASTASEPQRGEEYIMHAHTETPLTLLASRLSGHVVGDDSPCRIIPIPCLVRDHTSHTLS